MKSRSVASLLLAAVALSVTANAQAPPAARPAAEAKESNAPPASASKLDAQFIELLTQIASTRLERAKQLNAQVQGTFTPDDIALFQLQLNAVRGLGQDATQTGKVSWFAMLTELADASKIAADLEWRRTTELQQRSPQAISPADAKMAQLRAQLAENNMQRGKAVADKSADEQQNWALQFLFVEIQSLQDRVRNLEERE